MIVLLLGGPIKGGGALVCWAAAAAQECCERVCMGCASSTCSERGVIQSSAISTILFYEPCAAAAFARSLKLPQIAATNYAWVVQVAHVQREG